MVFRRFGLVLWSCLVIIGGLALCLTGWRYQVLFTLFGEKGTEDSFRTLSSLRLWCLSRYGILFMLERRRGSWGNLVFLDLCISLVLCLCFGWCSWCFLSLVLFLFGWLFAFLVLGCHRPCLWL